MSSSRSARRRRERRERPILEAFLDRFDEIPPGRLFKSESPDFLLHRRGHSLGIEITELHAPIAPGAGHPDRVAVDRRATLELAAKLSTLANTGALELEAAFSGFPQLHEATRGRVAKEIAACARAHAPDGVGERRLLVGGHQDGPRLPEEIQRLVLRRLPGEGPVRAIVREGDPEAAMLRAMRQAVEAKNAKLRIYQKNCTACWLVLVAGWDERGRGPIQLVELGRELGSRFERSFLLRCGSAAQPGLDRLAS